MTFLEQILREHLERLAEGYYDTRIVNPGFNANHIDAVIQAILPAVEDFVCLMIEKPKDSQEM